jgi:hypothetical protein
MDLFLDSPINIAEEQKNRGGFTEYSEPELRKESFFLQEGD